MKDQHKLFMKRAFELSKKARGLTRGNPLVGAVTVKDNKILSEGYHEYFGGPHAEANALKDKSINFEGATLYCTLEPCCHEKKKTPPCLPLILEKKIKHVIIAMKDPNPLVYGKSIEELRKAGVQVTTGILEKEVKNLNHPFLINMKEKRSYIHLKMAQTLDGKMVLPNGVSKWITGKEARESVHHLRSRYSSILVGGATYKNDRPSLTVRDIPIVSNLHFKQPERIIVSRGPVSEKREDFTFIEHEITNWPIFFQELYQRGVPSIFIEAGPNLISHFIEERLFDALSIYVAPKLSLSGSGLKGKALANFDESFSFSPFKFEKFSNGDIGYHYQKGIN